MSSEAHKIKLNIRIERKKMNPTNVNPNDNQMPEMPTPVNPVINPGAPTMPNVVPGVVEMGAETVDLMQSTAQGMPQETMPSMVQETVSNAMQENMGGAMSGMSQETMAGVTSGVVSEMMPPVMTAPVGGAATSVEVAAAAPAMVENQAPQAMPIAQNPMATATEGIRVGATDPITMPTPPKAPDPIEEELKAPMMAAAPVPGSIGSAISVPAGSVPVAGNAVFPEMAAGSPNNVAFNDPAQASVPTSGQPAGAAPAKAKKQMDKKTLIALCIVAGIVVIVLVIILAMTLAG